LESGALWPVSRHPGLARLHGGDLSLKSKLGEGTVATLLLPLEDYIAAPLPKLDLHKASAA